MQPSFLLANHETVSLPGPPRRSPAESALSLDRSHGRHRATRGGIFGFTDRVCIPGYLPNGVGIWVLVVPSSRAKRPEGRISKPSISIFVGHCISLGK